MHCIEFVSISFLQLQQDTYISTEVKLVIAVKYQLENPAFFFPYLSFNYNFTHAFVSTDRFAKIWIFKGNTLVTTMAFSAGVALSIHSVFISYSNKSSKQTIRKYVALGRCRWAQCSTLTTLTSSPGGLGNEKGVMDLVGG